MALEPKKQGGLFAGFSNLTKEQEEDGSIATTVQTPPAATKDAARSKKKESPSNKSISESVPVPVVDVASSVSESISEGPAAVEPSVPVSTQSDVPQLGSVGASSQSAAPVASVQAPPVQAPAQPPAYPYGGAPQFSQQGGEFRVLPQMIDGRYRRNPKSFRTCIALTEDLHQQVEYAKQTGRIVSLNDLVNNLLIDYFRTPPAQS